MESRLIIDAHQHFWKFQPLRDSWITDEMKVIQKDFLPADLQTIFDKYGISGSVVVQSDQSEEENHFQLENASANDFIKAVVGWVDLQADNLEERLNYYKQFPMMKGFRHVLQGEEDRSLMLKPAFMKGIGMLQRFEFTYDILIFPDQIKYCNDLLSSFPEQRFVLDHLAKPSFKNGSFTDWATDINRIGKHKNLSCKLSGMVTEADWKLWNKEDFRPCIDTIVHAFGSKRIMYGSDYPVCLLAATYEQVLEIVTDYFADFTEQEQDDFFSMNAINFYNIK